MSAPQSRVFSAYRRLFRARKELFAGDVQALRESRLAIKGEFVKNRTAPTAGDHFEGLLSMVDEAVDMLRHGIVRGDLNQDTGNYGKRFFLFWHRQMLLFRHAHDEGCVHSHNRILFACSCACFYRG